jgi:porin
MNSNTNTGTFQLDTQSQFSRRHPTGQNGLSLFSACALLAALCGHAMGQEVAGAENNTNLEMVEAAPPRNLPGQTQGERAPEKADAAPAAEAKAADREWFGGLPMWKWSHVTGDWAGARTWLADKGLSVNASFSWEMSSVWSGGANKTASDRRLWDVNSALDLEKAVGLKGGQIYADAYFSESSGGTADVGGGQGISNLDTYGDRNQLAELWYEQKMFDGMLRIKAGKIDANNEFDFISCAPDFLHASTGFSPTLSFFPSYPEPATGLVAFVYPVKQWYLGAGWFDGALQDGVSTGKRGPDQFFRDNLSSAWYFVGETGLTWEKASESLGNGRVAVGVHHATSHADTWGGDTQSGTTGFYAVAEQQVWRRGETDELKTKGLSVFAQFGYGDEDIAAIKTHIAGGVALAGVCESRMNDSTGVYVSFVDYSGKSGAPSNGNETAIEAYYKLQLTPAVSLTPDIQYIVNPGGDTPNLDNAWVGQVRLVVAF